MKGLYKDMRPPSADGKGGNGSERLPGRLSRYSKYHERSLSMAEYMKSLPEIKFLRKYIERLEVCGAWLHFRHYYKINEVRLHKGSFCCNHFLCPFCGVRRGLKATQAYMAKVKELMGQDPFIKFYHVVLTVKNGEDLQERYDHIMLSARKMREAKNNATKGLRHYIEFNKALGGVSSVEIKRGKNSGLWHPHLHCVWICKEAPDVKLLSQEWKEFTGDSFDVYITEFDIHSIEGFLEVFSYAVKFSTMELRDQYHAWRTLKGHRLINSFGIMNGVEISENLDDEPIQNQPYFDEYYKFVKGSGYNFIPIKRARYLG